MIEIIRKQPKVQNIELTKIVFINSVTTYLLNKDETSFNAILKPLGSIINTYHINISINDLKLLKQKFTIKDILFKLGEIITNNDGYKNNLIPFLRILITFKNLGYGKI